ncbi:MAG: hypothetical protein ACYCVH_13495 [Ignavibacteriaceae bacterium]
MQKTSIAFFETTAKEKKYLETKFDKNFDLTFYPGELNESNSNLISNVNIISPFIYSNISFKATEKNYHKVI